LLVASEASCRVRERQSGNMAAQGRGSAARGNAAAVAALVLLCVLLHGEVAESAVYTVGDRGGWGFNSASWPRGKRFRAGDVLGE